MDFKKLFSQLMGGTTLTPRVTLIAEDRLGSVSGVLVPEASRMVGEPIVQDRQVQYRRLDGVAILTVDGAMSSRGVNTDDRYRWQTYEGIQSRLRLSDADQAVHTLLIDYNTPGGYVAGCDETAALIKSIASRKRVVSYANPLAASAGYWLAAAGDEICISPSGTVGSIGVLMVHQNISKMMSMLGIETTIIQAGDHKTDGHPYGPLPDSVKADFDAEVNSLRDLFTARIGEYRPSLGAQGALDTQARCYFGADAVAAGLADRVIDFDSLLAELTKRPAQGRAQNKGATMITQEQMDAAVATARTEGHAAGLIEGTAAGTKATTDRFTAIINSEKVKGKQVAALELAMNSPELSSDAVITFVEKNVSAAGAKPSIAQRMDGQGSDLSLGSAIERPGSATSGWGKATDRVNQARGFK